MRVFEKSVEVLFKDKTKIVHKGKDANLLWSGNFMGFQADGEQFIWNREDISRLSITNVSWITEKQ